MPKQSQDPMTETLLPCQVSLIRCIHIVVSGAAKRIMFSVIFSMSLHSKEVMQANRLTFKPLRRIKCLFSVIV